MVVLFPMFALAITGVFVLMEGLFGSAWGSSLARSPNGLLSVVMMVKLGRSKWMVISTQVVKVVVSNFNLLGVARRVASQWDVVVILRRNWYAMIEENWWNHEVSGLVSVSVRRVFV